MTDYTALITSEHRDKPKFSALVSAVSNAFGAASDFEKSLPAAFDLDTAIGVQLDAIGLWVGFSRKIKTPLSVYFSFDIAGLGFDEGSIKGAFDPDTGLTSLDDETYRIMIRAKIGANVWNGTISGMESIYAKAFDGTGSVVFATDNQDMSLDVYVAGANPSAVMSSLLTNGYFPLKPAGVRINGYTKTSVTGSPMFGFDVQNSYVSGFDTGAFGVPL